MRRFSAALFPTGLFVITCVAFWPALQGTFNWDDEINVVANVGYRGFGPAQIKWMFTTNLMGHYMPFTWLSFALNNAVNQMDPWGYHLASLLLHAGNGILVYFVARRLLTAGFPGTVDMRVGASAAALLFAIHPQRVESVAWISDRGTVLCGAFYLLSILAYLRAVAVPSGRRRTWWSVASLVAFAAALLSKSMAMSLPITLLLLDWYPLRRLRTDWPRVLVEKLPYIALAAAGAVVAGLARSHGGAAYTSYASYGISSRIGLVGYSLWFYPTKLVWPVDLSPLYEAPSHVDVLDLRFLMPTLGVLAVSGVLLTIRHRAPGALAAWAHSAAVVAPVSGVVHSGLQMVADRYSYLAQLGFAVLVGYGLVRLVELYRQGRVRPAVAALAGSGTMLTVVALVVLTWSQSHVWRDPEMLWTWAVDQDPLCGRCHGNLGVALLHGRGDPQGLREAEEHLRRAVALRPEHALTYLNLGTVELLRGRYDEAEAALRRYLRRRPEAPEGLERLAVLYLLRGWPAEAVPLLRRVGGTSQLADTRADFTAAVGLIRDGETLRYLGQVLLMQGRDSDAVLVLRRAVELSPSTPGLRFWLAQAYRRTGQTALAEGELAALRELDPKAAAPGVVR